MFKKFILSKKQTKTLKNPIQEENYDSPTDDWECPICYSELDNNIGILFPYNCDHALCFDCFTNIVNYMRKQGKSPFKTVCSLCREPVLDRWKTNKKIKIKYCTSINFKKYKLYVC